MSECIKHGMQLIQGCFGCIIDERVAQERERCAKIAEKQIDPDDKDDPEMFVRWRAATDTVKEIRGI